MFSKIYQWIKQETVLVIAALWGILTMFFAPPSSEYIQYIDLKVLCLLFCLMTVVAGFQSCGVFHWLAIQLLKKKQKRQNFKCCVGDVALFHFHACN